MSTAFAVALTTFLASTVEAIEMVAIVAGVGATRGWRASLLGAAGAVLVLVLVAAAAVFGVGLTAIPIEVLRLVVGAVLLVFGLNWLRKGIRRVAASGLQGYRGHLPEVDEDVHEGRVDWTGFVLSFKGVLLEGLEVAFIVVTFGGASGQVPVAAAAGIVAVVVIGGLGFAAQAALRSIPRSALQLVVGVLLTTFGTFWATEGLGVDWPGEDAALLGLLALYSVAAAAAIAALRGSHSSAAVRTPVR